MRVILDTHLLLWALAEPAKLPRAARTAVVAPENEVLFSAASIWEIAIKARLGRADFEADPLMVARAAERTGMRELPVSALHAARTARLPLHHSDPFDRLLVAQAIEMPAHLLTVDGILGRYSDLVTVFA